MEKYKEAPETGIIASFKQALESTGYQVYFSNNADVVYNDTTIIAKIIELNEISYWIKADIYITAIEPADFITKLKEVDNMSLTDSLRTSISYFDDRFSWYQKVLWIFDKNKLQTLETKVETITLTIN